MDISLPGDQVLFTYITHLFIRTWCTEKQRGSHQKLFPQNQFWSIHFPEVTNIHTALENGQSKKLFKDTLSDLSIRTHTNDLAHINIICFYGENEENTDGSV